MEYLPTLISSLSTVICAIIAGIFARDSKKRTINEKLVSERADARAKEGRLQLAMLNANTKLCIGTAMALKNGHCNGELEEGLRAVEEAEKDYKKFLEEEALKAIRL